MSRTSTNRVIGGRLVDGYDYHNQAWVVDGVYQPCAHPTAMACQCFGKRYAGMQTAPKGEAYFNGETR